MAIRTKSWFQGILLGSFALVTAIALALGHELTAPEVAQRLKEDLNASLEQVVPAALRDNDMSSDTIILDTAGKQTTVYRARKNGHITAVAYRVIGNGYGGDIIIVMGVDRDGKILGVRVVQHAETPGLGDKIEILKSQWIKSFDGHSLDNTSKTQWAVKKDGGDFDQFSGATITPRGVVKAVHHGLLIFAQKRQEMFRNTGNDDASSSTDKGDAK